MEAKLSAGIKSLIKCKDIREKVKVQLEAES
jgi:hypothetical protein